MSRKLAATTIGRPICDLDRDRIQMMTSNGTPLFYNAIILIEYLDGTRRFHGGIIYLKRIKLSSQRGVKLVSRKRSLFSERTGQLF